MATVEQIQKSATAAAQSLIASDAKTTMAGKQPQEMKEHASQVLNAAIPTVHGCVEALAKDPRQLEAEDVDILAMRAVSLAAFGTPIGSTSSKRK
ncbi:hypothetical protein J7T55_008157 [Diaporthe amygdali]|uniref:uncharacterized protein n=1 Tax=Phomopsis amygdali TaxID=1214568 RepID=UPI0022FE3F7B|nr:uncharacterized protein J7T55_008157 [Diaporthe amygdali]KAJ0108021.1 hypothetical protein J7T55_008157 [Diaporthe amygdali]